MALTGFRSPFPVVIALDGSLMLGDRTTGTVFRIARS
jgi:hypothetical protein